MAQAGRRATLKGLGSLFTATLSAAAWAQKPPGSTAELRIGAIFPATGPLARLGEESFRGLELAVEARNAAGGVFGRPIRLVRAAAEHPAQAAAATRVLMSVERVAAVFGTGASVLSLPASRAAELQGVPFFELGAVADAVTARGFRLLFRAAPLASQYAALSLRACADLLPELWNTRPEGLRVAVLHENGAFGQAVGLVQESLLRQGIGPRLAVRLTYPAAVLPGQPGNPPPPPDFAALLGRLRESSPDVLLHSGQEAEAAALFATMADAGWMPRMLVGCGAGYHSQEAARSIGPGFVGTMAVGPAPYASGGALAEPARRLAERYAARYGHAPSSGHSLGHAMAAAFFLEALHRAGSPERERIRAAVLAMPAGDLSPGWPMAMDEEGQNRLARPVLSQWQGQGMALRQVAILGPAALEQPRDRMAPISSP
ncbi:ABC transporter substrate-binding protein [Pseudoroseomonas ludipueritiae]|uniref:ABC transporter substrate-binding protein n=1 Tax=Pseudoroseomonas ludipueritiae TaxID=198093 RepID=A0ABR7R1G5_9PROT|nr:ABC transporter substrate-binding protein [Pseudoroseomonas ludipueritiae]MBC9175497.1 ABC transporter substrate-binding protein [Pseudoroseomonas ludipueritiae]